MKKTIIFLATILFSLNSFALYLLIPMDDTQTNHLKAYGISYWILKQEGEVSWLLNYRGGSFLVKHDAKIEKQCKLRGVSYNNIADVQAAQILNQIAEPEENMDVVKLQNAPRIAVYSPKNKLPWDDAVTLVLTYAEIPYDVIYDEEIIKGVLPMYDWVHLHHEDFTGQYGKFWANYRNQIWYQEDVLANETTAKKLGFKKVSQLKLAVAKKLRDFVSGGGFMFAMCSAPDSFDIALAAEGVDICDVMFDGDPIEPNAQNKLDYSKCFAFKDFTIVTDPFKYAISNIDVTEQRSRLVQEKNDLFVLFDFSAKWDWIPTMLTQNHNKIIKGFMGQSTAFNKNLLKSSVLVLGENKSIDEVRYIHGTYGKGTWTFLSGHDPEDYQHYVGDPVTDLSLFPNSAGYRLILNNILFPSAKKEKQKT
ncbi:MAG: asparagine synthetase B [Bacteroidales bacterium]|nr:asparagine synthetase B [Bacteroidales bacterium]MDD4684010.1 asparagine synthetase B [Bacteroidales bacterium]